MDDVVALQGGLAADGAAVEHGEVAAAAALDEEFVGVVVVEKECEWVNSLVYGKHYEYKRNGLWHVYMNGKPLKDKNGKAILYNYNAQPH